MSVQLHILRFKCEIGNCGDAFDDVTLNLGWDVIKGERLSDICCHSVTTKHALMMSSDNEALTAEVLLQF